MGRYLAFMKRSRQLHYDQPQPLNVKIFTVPRHRMIKKTQAVVICALKDRKARNSVQSSDRKSVMESKLSSTRRGDRT
jgi:hypothetical protein